MGDLPRTRNKCGDRSESGELRAGTSRVIVAWKSAKRIDHVSKFSSEQSYWVKKYLGGL